MNLGKIFPFLTWISELKDKDVLRGDILAGVTVALILIPQSMAYAQLAGLPAYYGLYISLLPVMIAALWGSSRQLATGPVAVVSIMTATALAPVATSPEHYIALAMFMALLVGLFQLFLGVFRLGLVVNFLSHPVIVGFTNAAALVIGLSQLSKIFGVTMPGNVSDHFLGRVWGVLEQVGDTHILTLLMALAALTIMLGLKKYFEKMPGVLIAVSTTIVISWLFGFEEKGGAVVGHIPEGLPDFQVPLFSFDLFGTLLPAAIVIALVGFMEAISIAKAMAAKTKDHIDPNQELIGQGLANIAGSFTQAYPASGSFSRSAVNLKSGARTGFSSVVTAIIVVITLLFLTPLLYHLPQSVLAAVIMMAVFGLINFSAVKHAMKVNKHDGIASIVTFVATVGLAPHLDQGVLLGASLAIGLYLYRTMSPHIAFLGRHPDGTLRDITVYDNLPVDEKIVAIRFDGTLYFANVAYFEDAILNASADKPNAKFILVVGNGINQIDASGEEVLHHLVERLRDNGVQLVFSGLKHQIIEILERTHLKENIGGNHFFPTSNEALVDIYQQLEAAGDGEVYCPLHPEFDAKNYK